MKFLLKLLLSLGALVVLLLIALVFWLDGVVELVVEEGGTYALGVETQLEGADLKLLGGEAALAGLTVKNPEGYKEQHVFSLGSIRCELETSSLLGERIEVPSIAIDGVTLNIERNASGTNYDVILANLERLKGPEGEGETGGEAPPEGEQKPGKQVHIERIVLTNINANISFTPVGGSATTIPVRVPEVVINEVGGEEGTSVEDVFSVIIEAVLASVLEAGGDLIPADLVDGLGEHLARLEGLGDGLGGDVINKAGEALGDGAKELLEGVGGLEGLLPK